jgi:uncharacterized membrane protein
MDLRLSTMARLTEVGFTAGTMLDVLRGVALLAAMMTTGLMAGVFFHYANAVMPGLGRADDRTFVGAFQQLDRAILNPWFLTSFFGAPGFSVLAAALSLRAGERAALPWIAGAAVLSLAVVGVTLGVNVPLNDGLKAAGDPDRIADLGAVRERFQEARWVRWNLFRAVASTVAFGCLAWALVLHGRA